MDIAAALALEESMQLDDDEDAPGDDQVDPKNIKLQDILKPWSKDGPNLGEINLTKQLRSSDESEDSHSNI